MITLAKYVCTTIFISWSLAALALTPQFEGRIVNEVLSEYQSRGYQFLYSSGTVRRGMRFENEPTQGSDLERLTSALMTLNLSLVSDSDRAFRIVNIEHPVPPTPSTVSGRVVDAKTGLPIQGALVEIGRNVMLTDANGEFRLVAIGDITLTHERYVPKRVNSPAVKALLEFVLEPVMSLEEMLVVSSRYAVRDRRTRAKFIDLELLESVPSLGQDPIRLTNHLPGMATVGVSAKPHVRGGLQDEVLVLFNNLELLEPFHLRDFQSIFSSFNPSVIDSIDVYTGGFPARYGDRMSGVMDFTTDPSFTSSNGEVSVSLLNTSALLHGQSERSTWVTSVRRGNLDILTKRINSSVGEPAYTDAYAQLRFQVRPETELDIGLIAYNDDIELSDFDEDGEIASSKYRNVYGWAQIHHQWHEGIDGSTLFYFGRVSHRRKGFLVDEDLDNGRADVLDERAFKILSLGQTLRYRLGKTSMAEFGAQVTHYDGQYDYDGRIQRGILAELIGTQVDEQRQYRLRPKGSSGGMFFSLRGEVSRRLSLEGGLRWDYQSYGLSSSDDHWSPRATAKWKMTENSELRLSLGRFFQPEAIHELQVGDGQTRFQPAQYSDQAIFSWYQTLPWHLSLRTEAFYKWVEDPKRRYENLFNPLVLLPELASDRLAIAPSEARVSGFELTLKYDPNDSFLGWISYTRSKAEDRVAGRWEPRVWDQGHSVAAGLSYDGERWKIGASLLWHDGWRTTNLPTIADSDTVIDLRRNSGGLRDYLSLDFQISRTWQWPGQTLTAFLEVTNALSRKNVGGIEFDVEELEGRNGYELLPMKENLLPLVPSIGVRWSF